MSGRDGFGWGGWGSIRLAWMVLGWIVMVSGLGWYWAHLGLWVVSWCFVVISGGFGGIRLGLW